MYRCYMIWGSKWKVVAVPSLLMVTTFAIGCMSSIPGFTFNQLAPYICATVTNLVLMVLTAGRIWWVRRDALPAGADDRLRKCYSSIIVMILESGAVYCVGTILLIVTSPMAQYPLVEAVAVHLVNIVPTVIIVRVGLGQHTQDITEVDEKLVKKSTPLSAQRLWSGKDSIWTYKLFDLV
ncbi:hypothetical protein DFH06DRAFT_611642 [Mycena polygramma]|nr:hypothetical protein DFH06DRAFT_611642 [Mycena polygramma]